MIIKKAIVNVNAIVSLLLVQGSAAGSQVQYFVVSTVSSDSPTVASSASWAASYTSTPGAVLENISGGDQMQNVSYHFWQQVAGGSTTAAVVKMHRVALPIWENEVRGEVWQQQWGCLKGNIGFGHREQVASLRWGCMWLVGGSGAPTRGKTTGEETPMKKEGGGIAIGVFIVIVIVNCHKAQGESYTNRMRWTSSHS